MRDSGNENELYNDGIYSVEKVGKDYNLYNAGLLTGSFHSYNECVDKMAEDFNVQGEFKEACKEKFAEAVSDIKYLDQFHNHDLIMAALEEETTKK